MWNITLGFPFYQSLILSDVILDYENESQVSRISNYLKLKVTLLCCEISISENVNIPYPSVVTTKRPCARDSLMSESSFLFGQTEYKKEPPSTK